MATITIAGRAYSAARPANLADRILAATGLSLDEARSILVGSSLPNLLARAIDPLLTDDDRPSVAELGELIDPAEIPAIAAQVDALYADPDPAPAPAPVQASVKTPAGGGNAGE